MICAAVCCPSPIAPPCRWPIQSEEYYRAATSAERRTAGWTAGRKPAADAQRTDHPRLGLRDAPPRLACRRPPRKLVLAHVLIGALALVPEQAL